MTETVLPPPPAAAPPAVAPPGAPPPGAERGAAPRTRLGALDSGTRRQTIVVAAVIAALFYGSQILNEALPANAQGQVAAGGTVAIGEASRITPLDGWVVTPHEGGPGIRLEKGIVVIDLFPETFGQNAGDLAKAYLDEILRPDATQLTTTETEVATTPNGSAARFGYQGMFTGVDVPIEGEVTAVFVGGNGVIADAWSRQGDLGSLLGEVHAMLETIEVGS